MYRKVLTSDVIRRRSSVRTARSVPSLSGRTVATRRRGETTGLAVAAVRRKANHAEAVIRRREH